jgi:hypothetical protein
MFNTYTMKEVKLLRDFVDETHRIFVKRGLGTLESWRQYELMTNGEILLEDKPYPDNSNIYRVTHDTVTHHGIKQEGELIGILCATFDGCCEALKNQIIDYINERRLNDSNDDGIKYGLIWRKFPEITYQYPGYYRTDINEPQWLDGGYYGYSRLSIFDENGHQVGVN